MHQLKDATKKVEESLGSTITHKVRDSMKKYDPIIEGFEEMKRFKSNFLDLEDRFLDFQTKTQTKIVQVQV